ncbi:MAG: pantetheine-phosphate adenylyltransferase [Planctomycetota bacterium]|jgi:pantetheine-phosphate adenylyltransferase
MDERIAVFPGTFDPITCGHLDIIHRGARMFDALIVGVARNPGKQAPLFSAEERVKMIQSLVEEDANVRVECFDGMTVDFCREAGACAILRGIRTFADFEYECQLALANRAFSDIETVFVMASAEKSFVASTLIKEAVALGADVERFVPESVAAAMRERLGPDHGNTAGLQGDEI